MLLLNMLNNRVVTIKKSDFLQMLYDIYKDYSEDYLLSLAQGLMIVSKHLYHDKVNFEDYKGLVIL